MYSRIPIICTTSKPDFTPTRVCMTSSDLLIAVKLYWVSYFKTRSSV